MATRKNYCCSFCGKDQDQVLRLIAGPGGVYICDECVGLCSEIIIEEHGYSAVHGGWRAHVRNLSSTRQRTQRAAQPTDEEQDPGEWLFDMLHALGYTLVVNDDGRITATNEQVNPETAPQQLEGQVRSDGTIEWPDDEPVRKVLFHARVVELRSRV